MKRKTARQITFDVLTNYGHGYIHGYQLKNLVERKLRSYSITETHYPATYLRYLRIWGKRPGNNYRCVDKKKSLYEVL